VFPAGSAPGCPTGRPGPARRARLRPLPVSCQPRAGGSGLRLLCPLGDGSPSF